MYSSNPLPSPSHYYVCGIHYAMAQHTSTPVLLHRAGDAASRMGHYPYGSLHICQAGTAHQCTHVLLHRMPRLEWVTTNMDCCPAARSTAYMTTLYVLIQPLQATACLPPSHFMHVAITMSCNVLTCILACLQVAALHDMYRWIACGQHLSGWLQANHQVPRKMDHVQLL